MESDPLLGYCWTKSGLAVGQNKFGPLKSLRVGASPEKQWQDHNRFFMSSSVLQRHWAWCSRALTSEVRLRGSLGLQGGTAINGCCAAVRGAILGSRGVSFVLQVRKLAGESMLCGSGEGDQTRHSPPSSCSLPLLVPPGRVPLFLQRLHQHRVLEPCGNAGETQKGEEGESVSQPRVFKEIASSAVF